MSDYLTPEQAAEALGLSRTTITRCKQAGAPVHYFGPCGRTYRILISEWIDWMDAQGRKENEAPARRASVVELREARHKMMKKSC